MNNRPEAKYIKRFAALLLILAILTAVLVGCSCSGSKEGSPSESSSAESQAIDNTIEWKGKRYKYNSDLTNIMFLGIDRSDPITDPDVPGEAGQADCIMILSLDGSTKEGRMLQINRNTMVQLDVYEANGAGSHKQQGQITLQYAYSTGGSSSCWAMKKTLSTFLYGLEIDGYFALNFEGLAEINDAIGGVEVTMKDDYTYIDPDFKEGETVLLLGKKAERFVRYRDTEVFNSVQGRMERQVEYVAALTGQMKAKSGSKLYDILSPYLDKDVITDLDAETINALKNYTYLMDEVQYLPGVMKEGEKYEEFYVDDEALQELIFEMFYVEVN